jgi:hypothetical protein
MKTTAVFLSAALSIAAFVAQSASPPDPRFDGKWVGTETCAPVSKISADQQKYVPLPREAMIVIVEGGRSVGKIGGVCVGRYHKIRRDGNTLTLSAGDCKLALTLAKDGKSLTESGTCKYVTMWTVRMNASPAQWPCAWLPLQVSATFHREK